MKLNEESSDFVYLGKRIDKTLNYIQNNKTDLLDWFKQYIESPYLNMISGELEIEEEDYIFDYLDSLVDDLEIKYNTILENKKIMTNETLRMQFLSGVITESEYKTKLEESKTPKNKKSLKENFVGMSAINNPFPERKKEKYEDAFEHFLGSKYKLNEEMESGEFDNYLTGLFDWIDLGDEYKEGPQSYTFEKMEWADEDALGGEEAEMFEPAHEYITSQGTITLTDPASGTPLVFRTEGENIVVDFNTKDFSGLDEVKK